MITSIQNYKSLTDALSDDSKISLYIWDETGDGRVDGEKFTSQINVRLKQYADEYNDLNGNGFVSRGEVYTDPRNIDYNVTDQYGTVYTKQQMRDFYKNNWYGVAPGGSLRFEI